MRAITNKDAVLLAVLAEAVEQVEAMPFDLLTSPTRVRRVVDARRRAEAVYYTLADDKRGETMAEIFGKDRTAIIFGRHQHDVLLYADRYYAAQYHALLKCVVDKITINTIKQETNMFTGTISGNIGRAAEVKTINGKEYYKFSLAVQNNRGQKAQWVSVLTYKGNGGIGQYLLAGAGVLVQGRCDVSAYKGKDGEAHADVTIWADNVEITKFADRGEDKAENDLPAGDEDLVF